MGVHQPGSGGGGGGSKPVNSFLSSSNATSINLASGNAVVAYSFPADGSMGSDISLSSDGKTVTLHNDGLYTITLIHAVGADATAGATAASVQAQIVGTFDAGDPINADGPFPLAVSAWLASQGGGASEIVIQQTYPAQWFKGGDTFQVHLTVASYSAGSFSYQGQSCIVVTRVS